VVIVGAHVDHLGRGLGTNSLAHDDEKGLIHYGADDNASGVGGVLEIAHYLVNLKAEGNCRCGTTWCSPLGRGVYLGTIPDYTQGEVRGLKVAGVIIGGPTTLVVQRGLERLTLKVTPGSRE
jgi:hypothetical protein